MIAASAREPIPAGGDEKSLGGVFAKIGLKAQKSGRKRLESGVQIGQRAKVIGAEAESGRLALRRGAAAPVADAGNGALAIPSGIRGEAPAPAALAGRLPRSIIPLAELSPEVAKGFDVQGGHVGAEGEKAQARAAELIAEVALHDLKAAGLAPSVVRSAKLAPDQASQLRLGVGFKKAPGEIRMIRPEGGVARLDRADPGGPAGRKERIGHVSAPKVEESTNGSTRSPCEKRKRKSWRGL